MTRSWPPQCRTKSAGFRWSTTGRFVPTTLKVASIGTAGQVWIRPALTSAGMPKQTASPMTSSRHMEQCGRGRCRSSPRLATPPWRHACVGWQRGGSGPGAYLSGPTRCGLRTRDDVRVVRSYPVGARSCGVASALDARLPDMWSFLLGGDPLAVDASPIWSAAVLQPVLRPRQEWAFAWRALDGRGWSSAPCRRYRRNTRAAARRARIAGWTFGRQARHDRGRTRRRPGAGVCQADGRWDLARHSPSIRCGRRCVASGPWHLLHRGRWTPVPVPRGADGRRLPFSERHRPRPGATLPRFNATGRLAVAGRHPCRVCRDDGRS